MCLQIGLPNPSISYVSLLGWTHPGGFPESPTIHPKKPQRNPYERRGVNFLSGAATCPLTKTVGTPSAHLRNLQHNMKMPASQFTHQFTSGQITINPKPEFRGFLRDSLTSDHHLGWHRRVGRYNLPGSPSLSSPKWQPTQPLHSLKAIAWSRTFRRTRARCRNW